MNQSLIRLPVEWIEKAIHLIRGEKVVLDRDLAILYGVTTKQLNQAVKRNPDRFPEDFMFQLSMDEAKGWWQEVTAERLRSQTVTLRRGQHIKYRPYAFTEHGLDVREKEICRRFTRINADKKGSKVIR